MDVPVIVERLLNKIDINIRDAVVPGIMSPIPGTWYLINSY